MRHDPKGMTTRGYSLKLHAKERMSKLQHGVSTSWLLHGYIRQHFFSLRVVYMWNSLPEEVVTAESVNCIKGRFDRWNIGIKFKL